MLIKKRKTIEKGKKEMKKRIYALGMAAAMIAGTVLMTGCGSSDDNSEDLAYVKDKGTLVVGITDFEPMDYKDADGNWVGFDADMATNFAKSIGCEVEFVEIDWDSKQLELQNKSIDCVWNGMTLTGEVKKSMETSNAYCENAQVVVVKSSVVDQYKDKDSCKGLTFAVEAGSAGAEAVKEEGWESVEVSTQSAALLEVQAGTADAAVIDLLMAGAMVGEGTSFDDLGYTISLTTEEYGVGFRQGSDLAAALNEYFKTIYESGEMKEIATKYGTQETIIEQK